VASRCAGTIPGKSRCLLPIPRSGMPPSRVLYPASSSDSAPARSDRLPRARRRCQSVRLAQRAPDRRRQSTSGRGCKNRRTGAHRPDVPRCASSGRRYALCLLLAASGELLDEEHKNRALDRLHRQPGHDSRDSFHETFRRDWNHERFRSSGVRPGSQRRLV
jgi:hypothetical protein